MENFFFFFFPIWVWTVLNIKKNIIQWKGIICCSAKHRETINDSIDYKNANHQKELCQECAAVNESVVSGLEVFSSC